MGIAYGANYGRPSLDLNFARNKSLIDTISGQNLVTFSRPQANYLTTYVGSDGLIKYASADEPRFDHNPVTGECLGLLIEEQRQNLLTYSEQFDNAAWSKTGDPLAQVTPNQAVAPDGTITADLLIDGAGRLQRNVSASSTAQYTLTLYIKSAGSSLAALWISSTSEGRAAFDLSTESVTIVSGTASIQAVGGGWYRCSVTTASTISSSSTITPIINGDDCYIWGAQLEAGSFPTSYIPTTASTVTRSADQASITGTNFSRWYNNAEGSLCVKGSLIATPLPYAANQYSYLASIENTPTSETTSTATLAFMLREQLSAFSGASNAGSGAPGRLTLVTTGTRGTFVAVNAFNRSENNSAFILRQVDPVANYAEALNNLASPTVPNATRLALGRLSSNGIGMRVFHISRLTYYPTRLQDFQLQQLTK